MNEARENFDQMLATGAETVQGVQEGGRVST